MKLFYLNNGDLLFCQKIIKVNIKPITVDLDNPDTKRGMTY